MHIDQVQHALAEWYRAKTVFEAATTKLVCKIAEASEPFATGGKYKQLTVIKNTVTNFYDLTPGTLEAVARNNRIAHPRQVAMYLARQLTAHTLVQIGSAFGGRHHGTVEHSCKTVENRMATYPRTRVEVEKLKKLVSQVLPGL